ncbi:hypothetical protein [Salinispora arenicola]|uniref:hypothetical protein n=1 Tax=Salinispora arenicola TaxID=168697 RepID=UPI0016B99364|nr:hypothetical protein [Salinispora arenicola]NIL56220.1 hypothetical protein [Salinispora arenicola]NIL62149.1 hypothetical protein [Salinispora arenicola]
MTAPTVPDMMFTAAAAMACDGLPTPIKVEASGEFGLDLAFATHADLNRWAVHMRLPDTARHTQPYNRDDVPEVLTNVWGVWRGVRVRLHCCEPTTDTPPEFLPPEVVAA